MARDEALFATEILCAYSGGTAGPCAACGAVVLFLVEILNCALAWDFPEICDFINLSPLMRLSLYQNLK